MESICLLIGTLLTGIDVQDNYVHEIEEPSVAKVETLRILDKKKDNVLPGFKAASKSEHQPQRYIFMQPSFYLGLLYKLSTSGATAIGFHISMRVPTLPT